MSYLASDVKPKKRKQASAAQYVVAGPTAKKSRKDKATVAVPSTSAPATTEIVSVTALLATPLWSAKKDRIKSKSKGKSKTFDNGEFTVIRASVVVSIPPVFADDARAGVEEMLDSMLMRYIPALQGVVLAHSNLSFPSPKAQIIAECPHAVCRVEFDVMAWSPRVGMKLTGKVNLCSPDHISLLVHRTFNVSIPRHHVPTDDWEFEYGPTANDPEFGAEATAQENEGVTDAGKWKHRLTGDVLGEEGELVFTVVGLTVANQMLSLVGSLQSDPFSPSHVPQPSQRGGLLELDTHDTRPPATHVVDDEGEGVEDDEDEEAVLDDEAADQFAEGRRAAEEAEREERRRAEGKAVKKARKEQKRKAREDGREERKKRKKER